MAYDQVVRVTLDVTISAEELFAADAPEQVAVDILDLPDDDGIRVVDAEVVAAA